MMRFNRVRATIALVACALAVPGSASAIEIRFRNFSGSAAIGPPADAYAAKLLEMSRTVIGPAAEIKFTKITPMPAIPAAFGGDIVAAVGAGAAKGGFDAAYNSGSELNKAWGFIYNSGVPFGPNFDEHLGFLYGKSVDGGQLTGLELLQSIFDLNGRNVVAVPIVGSAEQLSGYFFEPIGDAHGVRGIGLEGFCQRPWKLRYLPPGENVLNKACDDLVARGEIPAKNISFIAAIPGGGSLVDAVKTGQLQGFEFATPVDDVSQLFNTAENPGTVGVRYVHFPGWQQQFLITWMLINKQVFDSMSVAQQTLLLSVARDHVISSYGENLRKQGPALKTILDANKADANPANDMVLVDWPKKDQALLRDATIAFLNARGSDTTLGTDRADFVRVLEAYRTYVRANDVYWDDRGVDVRMRFDDWKSPAGEGWEDEAKKGCGKGRK
jgi:TRAP-type mannitol/chloroaromatic compound transport system substrate-binding protein